MLDQLDWIKSQNNVKAWLAGYDIKVADAGYFAPFDLYTENGVRLEVKYSRFCLNSKKTDRHWLFNIARRGKLENSKTDFYILRCETSIELRDLGWITATHLVIPTPIKVKRLEMSLRMLTCKYSKYFNAVEPIREHPGHPEVIELMAKYRYGFGQKLINAADAKV